MTGVGGTDVGTMAPLVLRSRHRCRVLELAWVEAGRGAAVAHLYTGTQVRLERVIAYGLAHAADPVQNQAYLVEREHGSDPSLWCGAFFPLDRAEVEQVRAWLAEAYA